VNTGSHAALVDLPHVHLADPRRQWLVVGGSNLVRGVQLGLLMSIGFATGLFFGFSLIGPALSTLF